MKCRKIGIIGLGFVGSAIKNWAEEAGYEIFIYDKFQKVGSIEEVNKGEILYIAVPTPYVKGGSYDDSAVRESLDNINDGKIVVIKSTVLPGTTDDLQLKYSEKKIVFNPEFLTEKSADKDFSSPDRQIVGFTEKSKDVADFVMNNLPEAPKKMIIPALDAELVKYAANVFLATKVIYANMMYDLCEKMGANYENVKDGFASDSRIGHSHLNIFYEGFRGYGGKCLPKDVRAFMSLAEKMGIEYDLIKAVDQRNNELTGNEFDE
jgi:UDPglucose 6-dehydrogenase